MDAATIRIGAIGACFVLSLVIAQVTGCRDRDGDEPPAGDSTAQPSAKVGRAEDPIERSKAAAARGVDAQDDPDAPPYLPASLEAGEWIKTRPVDVTSAEAWLSELSSGEAGRYQPYHVRRVVRCGYSLEDDAGAAVQAEVTVLETASNEDAYALLCAHAPPTAVLKIGGETRLMADPLPRYDCWQGRNLIEVRVSLPEEPAKAEASRLLMQIAGGMKRDAKPALLSAVPRPLAGSVQRWVVRTFGSMTSGAAPWLGSIDAAEMDRALGLGSNTLVCVSQYDHPQARGPNLVWVVRYGSDGSARQAHARLERRIDEGGSPWRSTNALPPQGAYLAGTWTAEEESMQLMLPRMAELLPNGKSTRTARGPDDEG